MKQSSVGSFMTRRHLISTSSGSRLINYRDVEAIFLISRGKFYEPDSFRIVKMDGEAYDCFGDFNEQRENFTQSLMEILSKGIMSKWN